VNGEFPLVTDIYKVLFNSISNGFAIHKIKTDPWGVIEPGKWNPRSIKFMIFFTTKGFNLL